MSQQHKPCFVISPIGEPDSETRKRSDQVLKYIIRPAVESCGYTAERADEMDKPGMITSQVIQRVVSDPLVVADLTERNPNVFYELAIRHAIRKPFVQLIKKGERIPFDVAGARTIQVDHSDLDSVERAKIEIIKQIKSLEADSSDLETPISMSLDLQVLRHSDKPEERSLADLLAAVSDMRSIVAKVEGKLPAVEEVQVALKALTGRFEEYLESPPFRRKYRFHPMMVHEMMHFSARGENRETAVLVVASMFRDNFPWVYEAGMEAYRAIKRGDTKAAREAM
ncbi:MAG: hypothetical protein Q7R41_16915, partial [Phycisphaerales bacterium]|nr:hypothetical protein [Phycisphaerales bacterium]